MQSEAFGLSALASAHNSLLGWDLTLSDFARKVAERHYDSKSRASRESKKESCILLKSKDREATLSRSIFTLEINVKDFASKFRSKSCLQ